MSYTPMHSTLIFSLIFEQTRYKNIILQYKLNCTDSPKNRRIFLSSYKRSIANRSRQDPLSFSLSKRAIFLSSLLREVFHFKHPFSVPLSGFFLTKGPRCYAICLRNEKARQKHMHINSYIRVPTLFITLCQDLRRIQNFWSCAVSFHRQCLFVFQNVKSVTSAYNQSIWDVIPNTWYFPRYVKEMNVICNC